MLAYSAGGTGDFLIVFAKLFNHWKNNKGITKDTLIHSDKHPQYQKAITEIIQSSLGRAFLTEQSKYNIVNKDQRAFEWGIKEAANNGGTYILTHVNDPLFTKLSIPPMGNSNFPLYKYKYICIHTAAGRMEDGSKRTIDKNTIQQIIKYSTYQVILIGPEVINIPDAIFVPTPSILDAFSIIDNCIGFIGQDGVLAYYSLIQEKPTLINFHIPDLVRHYMNIQWAENATILKGYNNLQQIPQLALEDFYKKV